MPLTDVPGKARALYEARRTRQPIEPFTDANPDLGMADGYAVQQQLTRMLLADGDRIVGYKVGLTSKPMQKMIGVDRPDYGPVLGSTVYADGVANLSRGPGIVKFYLARFDPDPSDAKQPAISTMAGQVVMSAIGFAATTIFFSKQLAEMVQRGEIDKAVIDELVKGLETP